ncbi:unnamed protein product [Choristocarpus tenellus]
MLTRVGAYFASCGGRGRGTTNEQQIDKAGVFFFSNHIFALACCRPILPVVSLAICDKSNKFPENIDKCRSEYLTGGGRGCRLQQTIIRTRLRYIHRIRSIIIYNLNTYMRSVVASSSTW